ncbi:hypothetical protein TWF106_006347 [Orbilia oligospora]|uniref:Uncharacterized protein n=1 Tax=Orbilia oligospora TaxID=2813651 RepID=A0A7C8VCU4_ORBOL|nr:hypothetical protein TWF788_006716 [Orbilia oligospora]KAF3228826.1 hypothetical protein TWF106_006347 [Orbilia oligospora]
MLRVVTEESINNQGLPAPGSRAGPNFWLGFGATPDGTAHNPKRQYNEWQHGNLLGEQAARAGYRLPSNDIPML